MLGVAAHVLGIRPWEWRLMTAEETDRICDWLDEYLADMRRAEDEMKRG